MKCPCCRTDVNKDYLVTDSYIHFADGRVVRLGARFCKMLKILSRGAGVVVEPDPIKARNQEFYIRALRKFMTRHGMHEREKIIKYKNVYMMEPV